MAITASDKTNGYYPFMIFGLIFFIAQCFIVLYPGDDTYFVDAVSKSKSLVDFVAVRYKIWSGRLAPEFAIGLFSLMNLWIWRMVNTIVATFFVYWMSRMVTQTRKRENGVGNGVMNVFVCLSFFIVPVSVTTRGCSSFTASFFYLWSALACFLCAYPFLSTLYGGKVTAKHFLVSFPAALFASYMQQTALFLIFFNFIALLYVYKRDHKFYLLLFVENAFIVANFIISISAPGNFVRYVAEKRNWYPTFDDLSLFQKLIQGISWTHLHLVRDAAVMMLLISVFLFVILVKKSNKLFVRIAAFIPSLYFIGSIFPANKLVSATTSHEYTYDMEGMLGRIFFNPMGHAAPLLISGAVIAGVIILLIACITDKNDRFLCVILLLAGLASGYILGFSPTVFASGPRIFFLTDMLLIIVSGVLLKTMAEEVPMNKTLWRIGCACFCSMAGINALIYVGGIAIKTLYKAG
jgi:hypothetical protein